MLRVSVWLYCQVMDKRRARLAPDEEGCQGLLRLRCQGLLMRHVFFAAKRYAQSQRRKRCGQQERTGMLRAWQLVGRRPKGGRRKEEQTKRGFKSCSW